jgi:hypothetical protein
VGILALVGIFIYVDKKTKEQPVNPTDLIEPTPELNESEKYLVEVWNNNKKINSDYKAQLVFDSGLLNLPIVQAYNDIYNDKGELYTFYDRYGAVIDTLDKALNNCDMRRCNGNDVYIYMDWQSLAFNTWGSNFFDYRNALSDQNLILYVHHANRNTFGDEKAEEIQGTKLDLLLDKENYEENKYFYLVTNREIRTYEIAYVDVLDLTVEENLNIYRTYLDMDLSYQEDDYWNKYIRLLDKNAKYKTGVKLENTDKLLTISTCIQGDRNNKEIIVAKRVSSKIYQNPYS